MRWQVQGVSSAFASACACVSVVIASIDTMRLRHRCGCVNRYDALASPLLLRLRYAALASVILSHFRPTVCHTRGGACTSRGGLARGVAAPVAGAVQGQYIAGCFANLAVASPTTVSCGTVSRASSVPMLVVEAVCQQHLGHSWLAADARACLSDA